MVYTFINKPKIKLHNKERNVLECINHPGDATQPFTQHYNEKNQVDKI